MYVAEKITPKWISDNLRELRLHQKDLADYLQIAPSAITRLLAGERKLQGYEIDRVREFFARYIQDPPSDYDPEAPPAKTKKRFSVPVSTAEMVPIFAGLEQRAAGHEPAEWRVPPATLRAVKDVFGFFVSDDALAPLLMFGDVAYVHPGKPARDGARVIVEDRKGRAQAGLIVRGEGTWRLRSGDTMRPLNPGDGVHVIAAIEVG